MKLKNLSTVFIVAAAAVYGIAAQAVTIDLVPVGNPGNTGELSGCDAGGYGPDAIVGGVGYIYQIGKYEITAAQYCEFLNAMASTDTYGLYNTAMDYDAYPSYLGCNIKRTGSSGIYSYSVAADWANRPVNYVSRGDAMRFTNWMHNGQPTGPQDLSTTEDGAYYLNGKGWFDLMDVTRKNDAKWWIPSEDEWYKAAYHKNDGVTGNYWDYPTGTDSVPSNDLLTSDPGNNANFEQDGYTIGNPYYRTPVGEFENSESPYGTFDQGGNVWEWNDTAIYYNTSGLRGGAFVDGTPYTQCDLLASARNDLYRPLIETADIGFRVASVPEPGSMMLLLTGVIAALVWRLRRIA